MNQWTVSGKECAALLGKSKAWLAAAIKDGMPGVARVKGRRDAQVLIDLTLALPYLVDRKDKRSIAPESARERVHQEQADRLALENEESRGKLCRMDVIEQLALRAASGLASELDGLPGRLAGELATITDPATIKGRLLEECRRVRTAYADHLGRLVAGGDDRSQNGARTPAAAQANAERMG